MPREPRPVAAITATYLLALAALLWLWSSAMPIQLHEVDGGTAAPAAEVSERRP